MGTTIRVGLRRRNPHKTQCPDNVAVMPDLRCTEMRSSVRGGIVASNSGPVFLDSAPLGQDLLEGQSQEQLAESVAQLINSDNPRIRLVGLDCRVSR